MRERTISVTVFKAKCLALFDQVADKRASYVVTKRGRAVARVVPIEVIGGTTLKGSVTFLTDDEEDLFSTGEAWTAQAETDAAP